MMNRILNIIICFLLFFSYTIAQSDGFQQNLLGESGTFAITNVRIFTVSGSVIEKGTIVIEKGKISKINEGVTVPSNAKKTIDGTGLSVYPGLIDAATNLGLSEIPLGANGTVDVSEVGENNANAKAIIGINPHSSHVNVARVNGITTVLSMPIGGLISGQAAVINCWGSTQADMAIIPVFGLVVNFPRVSLFANQNQPQIDLNEAIRRRDQQLENLRKIFKDAQAYAKAKEAYTIDKTLPAPKTDLKLEALIPYVRGEKPVIFSAEREKDIRAVAKFIEEFKLKGIILGGQEAWKAADVLVKQNIPVIYTNIYRLPVRDDDPYDYLFEAPAKMLRAGIKFAIATNDSGAMVRDLPYQAGIAAAFGLPKEEALKAVTLYPAQILGIEDRLGSLDIGKIANLVVTDGDILDPRTNVKYLFIQGRLMPLTSRHTELFERFKDRKLEK